MRARVHAIRERADLVSDPVRRFPNGQVEFYDIGADPKTPTRIFSKTETFELLGVPIHVADLFQD